MPVFISNASDAASRSARSAKMRNGAVGLAALWIGLNGNAAIASSAEPNAPSVADRSARTGEPMPFTVHMNAGAGNRAVTGTRGRSRIRARMRLKQL